MKKEATCKEFLQVQTEGIRQIKEMKDDNIMLLADAAGMDITVDC